MSTDQTDDAFGDTIRSALHAGTADLTAPPTLLPQLHKRYTRRVAARRAALVSVPLAIAVLVGALTSTANIGQPVSPTQIVDANMSAKITAALDGVEGDVVHLVTVETEGKYGKPGKPATIHKWVLADDTAQRIQVLVEDEPVFDFSDSPAARTTVDYRDRTWSRDQYPTTGNKTGGKLDSGVYTPETIKEDLRTGGMWVVGDGEVINGRSTIQIRTDNAGRKGTSPISLWIDRDTYLPVRSQYIQDGGQESPFDLTWLQATPENLDLLNVPIPEGFTLK